MKKIFLYGLFLCSIVYGQAVDDSLYRKQRSRIKSTFNNSEHWYLGFETGLAFNISPTQIVSSGPGLAVNKNPFIAGYDLIPLSNIKLNLGYNFQRHYLQFGFGGIFSKIDFTIFDADGNVSNKHKSASSNFQFYLKYYYHIPIKSRFLKLLIGPEIGYVIQYNAWLPGLYGTGFPYTTTNQSDNNFAFGANLRLDYKISKLLTIYTQFNYSGTYPGSRTINFNYQYYTPSSNTYTPQSASIKTSMHNINFTLGLNFDFYFKETTIENYARLQIPLPERLNNRYLGIQVDKQVRKKKNKENRKPKREIANYLNHFYFGLETGILIAPGANRAEAPQFTTIAGTRVLYFFAESSRFIIGGTFKKHSFEFGLGGLQYNQNLKVGNYSDIYSNRYLTIFFRYFYSLPIPSKRFKVLVGPEIGLGRGLPYDLQYNDYYYFDPYYNSPYHISPNGQKYIGTAGGNLRFQYKAAKNLTTFFQFSVTGCFTEIPKYSYPMGSGITFPSSAYFYGSSLNLNFTLGMTFDFYDPNQFEKELKKLQNQ